MNYTSSFWELIDGFGDKEKHLDYANESLLGLKKEFPFLHKHKDYLAFLEKYAGLTLEPKDENEEEVIGTIWGIGANIPHLLDDEGEAIENGYFHFADFYYYDKSLYLSFGIRVDDSETGIYLKVNYPENFSLNKPYENYRLCFSNFNSFLETILNQYKTLVNCILNGQKIV
jgi:hypothetical protein